MQLYNIVRSLFYYLFTSGLFISLTLVFLEVISKQFNVVNFFAFASGSFFIINLFQYNTVDKNNSLATPGFLLHTLLGSTVFWLLALTMIILYKMKYKRGEIINIILSLLVFFFVIYIYAYKNGYLNFSIV
jgi:glucan phosphoethanolaminetransferase (alkaline phosphatase superfamily)